ncbi:MAG: CHAT domain-containing protein, partial [Limnospira sp.]
EDAIACYRDSLLVRTPATFPLNCLGTGRNLGDLGFEEQNWETAIFGYDNAIRAVEQSRNWATSPDTKRQLIEDALPLYGKMVQACIHLERYEQALLTVERSKSRTLLELLSGADLVPKNATPEQQQRYRQLNREIAALQQSFGDGETSREGNGEQADGETGSRTTPHPTEHTPHPTQLQSLIQQRETLLAEIDDPEFEAIRDVRPQLPDFTRLLTPETALIEWYLPRDPDLGAWAFTVTLRDNRPHIRPHTYTPERRRALDEFNETYFSDYRQDTWYNHLAPRLAELAGLLDLPELLDTCAACTTLILVPHLYLHLFPLHALPVERSEEPTTNRTHLIDYFSEGVRFAPSCQILDYIHTRRRPAAAGPFFAIQNPTQDLPYTDVEVEFIRRRFDPDTHILKHHEANKVALNSPATLDQLSRSLFVHFSCHGGFDGENPLNSALILAGDAPPPAEDRRTLTLRDGRRFDTEHQGLTLREIYANLELPACLLVMLSACETGLIGSLFTDEYIGLASGFFYAGAPSVVSSLWCVDDFATALLAIRFYQEFNPDKSIAEALKAAQTWMRRQTKADLLNWFKGDWKLSKNDLDECAFKLLDYDQDSPFTDPKYWSAFVAIGL